MRPTRLSLSDQDGILAVLLMLMRETKSNLDAQFLRTRRMTAITMQDNICCRLITLMRMHTNMNCLNVIEIRLNCWWHLRLICIPLPKCVFMDAAESLLQLFEGVCPDTRRGSDRGWCRNEIWASSHITVILRQDGSENIAAVVDKGGCFRFYWRMDVVKHSKNRQGLALNLIQILSFKKRQSCCISCLFCIVFLLNYWCRLLLFPLSAPLKNN